jgi:hypothetical protein
MGAFAVTKHDPGSFKKAAVLTGLTVMMGGAEVSTADAATTVPQVLPFNISNTFHPPVNLDFNQFNDAGGTLTLTGVNVGLNSNIDIGNTNGSFTATVSVNSAQLFSTGSPGPFNGSTTLGANPFFVGLGTFPVVLALNPNCEGTCSGEGWLGQVSVSFNYDPAQSAVPLPAALPLFASGAAGLGVLGWRNRRKQKTKKA